VRIPLGPHSTARLLVMASTPALAIADGTVKGAPISADTVRIITTLLGSPASIQRLATERQTNSWVKSNSTLAYAAARELSALTARVSQRESLREACESR